MKVLVLGKSGQVARSLARLMPDAAYCSREEIDLRSPNLESQISFKRPQFIVNCAAYTAVDAAEDDRDEAWEVNARSVARIAELASQLQVPLLHISTDYVFDGESTVPYLEESSVRPLNVYGASKLAGESEVVARGGDHWWILRTSWIFSEFGNNFLKTVLRLAAERNSLSIVDDQEGRPTYAVDVARIIVQFIRRFETGSAVPAGIYHFASRGSVTWYGFAQAILGEAARIGLAKSVPELKATITAEFPTKAARPRYSVLDIGRIEQVLGMDAPDWRIGMTTALDNLARSRPETESAFKTEFSQLAIAGGTPAFASPRHVGRPNLGNRQRLLERIEGALDRGWLSNAGPLVTEFGRELERRTGAKHVIPVVNGTIALEVAIRALDFAGEVIVPSFTFVATAHALQWQQITPVFCDIDPATHNIDPRQIERLITPKTTGILAVHVWGRPCGTTQVERVANNHGLKVLYDAAHAFNVSVNGRKIGGFGNAEVFSFHATKFMNSLEGGAIATNDDALAEKIRLMINFGFRGYDNVEHIGTNGKMNEFSAGMGLTVLESLEEIIELNKQNYELYRECLRDVAGLSLINYDRSQSPNYQYVVTEIDETETGISRDQLVKVLHAENVLARKYFYPGCHRMEPYKSLYPAVGERLPSTDRLVARVMSLPSGTGVSRNDIRQICHLIRLAVSQSRRTRLLCES